VPIAVHLPFEHAVNLVTAKLIGDYFYSRQCALNCSVRIPFWIFVGFNTQRDRDGDEDGDDEGDIDIKGCLVDEREVFLRQCIGGKKCQC
jgi:hypothetical protein